MRDSGPIHSAISYIYVLVSAISVFIVVTILYTSLSDIKHQRDEDIANEYHFYTINRTLSLLERIAKVDHLLSDKVVPEKYLEATKIIYLVSDEVAHISELQGTYKDPELDPIVIRINEQFKNLNLAMVHASPVGKQGRHFVQDYLQPLFISVKQLHKLHQIKYDDLMQNEEEGSRKILRLLLVGLLLTTLVIGYRLVRLTRKTLTQQRDMHEALQVISEATSKEKNKSYFSVLVEQLAKVLKTDYAFIARLEGNHTAKTIAVCDHGEMAANLSYKLKDTPCEKVVESGICCYPDSVTRYYPKDDLLVQMKIEAYMGYPLKNLLGEVIGIIVVLNETPLLKQDISESMLRIFGIRAVAELERLNAERVLAQQMEDIARSNAELEQFAYVASNDLQEPLRMVGNYAQLIERRYKEQLDNDAKDFIQYLVDGVSRMQGLVNDLLAYSQIGRKQKDVKSPIHIEPIFDACLKNLNREIINSGASITHEPFPVLKVERLSFGQLLQNLISNAIKFRGKEAPKVHLSVTEKEDYWQFCVEDNGIGIDPRYYKQIFIIFQRLQSRQDYEGTGVGLALCRRIVRQHGGKIWVESEANKGSRFFFTIPK
ncbi:MAG: ATP-binding protein [Gammaproteobacteria bacterium]|nr:ATP-binding protein [Gammaproteobacteria bacterium]